MKILIAEDERISQNLLRAALQSWGHDVVVCEDGAQAWDILQGDDAPQLAILDWMMPKMEGLEVCRHVRENSKTRHTYLILLTARQNREDLIQGLESGADDYVIKPFNRDELHVRLQVGERVVALQAQALAAEKVRVMMQTAGAAAHEINQPLSVIMGIAELWMHTLSEDHVLCVDAKYVHEAACRIRDIVKQMQMAKEYATTNYVGNEKIIDFTAASKKSDLSTS